VSELNGTAMEAGLTSSAGVAPNAVTAGADLELWLAEQTRISPVEAVFWAPHG
jgi:hypothetical protein